MKERVRVLETYKGRLLPGAEITVIQQTGYISVNDYINSYAKTDRETVRNMMLQNIPVEDAGNMVLDQTQGVPLDQAGDKIVFCLWVSPQSDGEKTYYEPSEIGPESRWTWEMIHLPSFILLLTVMRDELPAKIMKPEV